MTARDNGETEPAGNRYHRDQRPLRVRRPEATTDSCRARGGHSSYNAPDNRELSSPIVAAENGAPQHSHANGHAMETACRSLGPLLDAGEEAMTTARSLVAAPTARRHPRRKSGRRLGLKYGSAAIRRKAVNATGDEVTRQSHALF